MDAIPHVTHAPIPPAVPALRILVCSQDRQRSTASSRVTAERRLGLGAAADFASVLAVISTARCASGVARSLGWLSIEDVSSECPS